MSPKTLDQYFTKAAQDRGTAERDNLFFRMKKRERGIGVMITKTRKKVTQESIDETRTIIEKHFMNLKEIDLEKRQTI